MEPRNDVFVSTASAWEIAIKRSRCPFSLLMRSPPATYRAITT